MQPATTTNNDFKQNFKPEFMEEKEPIRKNEDYIHKVMAPSFVTDQKNNISFSKGEGSVYGVGPYAERRDLKIGLPKLKHLDKKIEEMGSYHLIGKLTKDRGVIN